jgi:hypothetical protein
MRNKTSDAAATPAIEQNNSITNQDLRRGKNTALLISFDCMAPK